MRRSNVTHRARRTGQLATMTQYHRVKGETMTTRRQQRHQTHGIQIARYVAFVIALTAVVVTSVFLVTDNWASGGVIGAIVGGLAAALYSPLARRRR